MVEDNLVEVPSPEVCVSKIFEISGVKFDPQIAVDLWPKILKHKWLLSEKLGRDVGLRMACVDFVDNMEQALDEYLAYKRKDLLSSLGAQTIGRHIWDTISDSQPPKQLVALLPRRRGLGTLGITRGLGPWQPGKTRQQSG